MKAMFDWVGGRNTQTFGDPKTSCTDRLNQRVAQYKDIMQNTGVLIVTLSMNEKATAIMQNCGTFKSVELVLGNMTIVKRNRAPERRLLSRAKATKHLLRRVGHLYIGQ